MEEHSLLLISSDRVVGEKAFVPAYYVDPRIHVAASLLFVSVASFMSP